MNVTLNVSIGVLADFNEFIRESSSEMGLYPRVAVILTAMVKAYEDSIPPGLNIMICPAMSFCHTDKSTDYAVIVVSARLEELILLVLA